MKYTTIISIFVMITMLIFIVMIGIREHRLATECEAKGGEYLQHDRVCVKKEQVIELKP